MSFTPANEPADPIVRPATDPRVGASITVETRMKVDATPVRVWDSLMFYEGIEEPPPLYLKWMLPRPIRTEGSKSAVGDQATCLYQGGHLLKRVTRIDAGKVYEFAVIEQQLRIGGSVRLSGGSYTLRETSVGGTALGIITRYTSRNRPRWLTQPIEEAACHLFHRHLLNAIRIKAEAAANA